jgi:hypothetical protein
VQPPAQVAPVLPLLCQEKNARPEPGVRRKANGGQRNDLLITTYADGLAIHPVKSSS